MSDWLYVAACVVVPAAWGVLMYFVFGALRRRRQRETTRPEQPPVDYSI